MINNTKKILIVTGLLVVLYAIGGVFFIEPTSDFISASDFAGKSYHGNENGSGHFDSSVPSNESNTYNYTSPISPALIAEDFPNHGISRGSVDRSRDISSSDPEPDKVAGSESPKPTPTPAPSPKPTPNSATKAPQATKPAPEAKSKATYSAEDLDLLARLITAESQGEPYEAQVGVGAVVMNRVKSSAFPNTIGKVIYEVIDGYYQFAPVENGWIDKPALPGCVKAAKEALSGRDPTNGALFYYDNTTSNPWILAKPVSKRIGIMVYAY